MNNLNYILMTISIFTLPLNACSDNALIQAARVGNYDEVQKALAHDVNLNDTDDAGLTALHYAIGNNCEDIVNLLKDKTNLAIGIFEEKEKCIVPYSLYKSLKNFNGFFRSIAWSSDSFCIRTTSYDKTAKTDTLNVWDLEGNLKITLENTMPFWETEWSLDGSRIATVSFGEHINLSSLKINSEVIIWDLKKNSKAICKYSPRIHSLAWSPNGKYIAAADIDRLVNIWDLEGTCIATLKHNDCVNSIAWLSDSSCIATISSNNIVKLWDLEGNSKRILKDTSRVKSLAWSPDSKYIATVNDDNTVNIRDLERNLEITLQHNDSVSSVAWSPGSKSIATASKDKTTKIWDLEGNLKTTLQHTGPVNSVVWSPDCSRIATVDDYNTVKLWVKSGTPIDYAVSNALATSTTNILEILLDQIPSLDEYISSYLPASLSHARNNAKKNNHLERYQFICKITKLLAQKSYDKIISLTDI